MKTYKKILGVVLAVLFILYTPCISFANNINSKGVTVGGSAGVSGGKPSAGVSLSFTPSIIDKQWQLYNYVSYNW